MGVLGLGWEEDRGDLRGTAEESRFEKKERKAGMGKRSREDAVVGEDGVWPGHLLKAANQTDAQRTRRPTTGPGRHSPIIINIVLLYLRGTLTTAYIAPSGYSPPYNSRTQIEPALAQPRRISSPHPGSADGRPRFIVRDIFSHVS